VRGVGAEALGVVGAGDAGVDLAGGHRHPAQRHRAGGSSGAGSNPPSGWRPLSSVSRWQATPSPPCRPAGSRRHPAHRVHAPVTRREWALPSSGTGRGSNGTPDLL
jgi:hypothetical protein